MVKSESIKSSAERLAQIKPTMRRYIDEGHVPCLLTVIAHDSKVVHFEAQGYSDVDKQVRLQADAIFRLFSMTKPITIVATMMLYEEHRFSLDDPIAKYLPEFEAMQVWTEQGLIAAERAITIRHLLTHTAGLTYSGLPNPVADIYTEAKLHGVRNRLSGDTLAQHVKRLAAMPLLAQPGVAWNYSEAMGVLGRLVEVLSGSTFREFLVNRVFTPLAMVDTDFYVPKDKIDRLIPLYQVSNDQALKLTDCDDYGGNYCSKPALEYGGAGLVGTSADYLRFAQMLLNDGELEGARLLSASSVRLIMTDHLGPEFGDTPLASLDAPVTSGLGLGFGFGGYVVRDASSTATLGSDGEYAWGGWASTDFWIDPKRKLIGILLTQVIPIDVQLTTRAGFHDLVYQAAIEI